MTLKTARGSCHVFRRIGYGSLTIATAFLISGEFAAAQTKSSSEENEVNRPQLRFIESNGIRMRIAEMGEGPLVLLLHGWPESWYSWRHQLPALAQAGYRAVAPDMRGYGQTDAPEAVEEYDIVKLAGDAVGILDALGEETAVVIGHDWGAVVAWHCALLHPQRFRAVIALSVPYGGRPEESYLSTLKRNYGDNFFYMLYFQEPGVAEAEFDADPRGILSRLYTSPTTPREKATLKNPKRTAGGWIPRLGAPRELPDWLTAEDLDFYVNEFTKAGFRGGINFYRNLHRNWEITPQLSGAKVQQPALFVAGEKDVVIRGATQQQLTNTIGRATEDLRGVKLIPEIGHWVQQESPEETNTAILEFLGALD